MKKTISYYEFKDWFNRNRPNNFSESGLTSLFEFIEQWEEDTGEEFEFDPIGICCDYTEYENIEEYNKNYEPVENLDQIRELTTVIEITNPKPKGFIIQNY